MVVLFCVKVYNIYVRKRGKLKKEKDWADGND